MPSYFKLFDFLPFQLFVISALGCEQLKEIYTKYDIENNKEWRIMALLNEFGKVSMSKIAKESFIDPVNVTRSVENLFQKKYCERYYDQEDRRRVEIELSKEGKKMMRKLIPELKIFEEKFKKIAGGKLSDEFQVKYDSIFKDLTHDRKPKIN